MGRLGVLVGKELRQVRWVLWVGLGLTLLFGLSLPYFYRFISRIAGAGVGLLTPAQRPSFSGERGAPLFEVLLPYPPVRCRSAALG